MDLHYMENLALAKHRIAIAILLAQSADHQYNKEKWTHSKWIKDQNLQITYLVDSIMGSDEGRGNIIAIQNILPR